jgi:hypothetical protein
LEFVQEIPGALKSLFYFSPQILQFICLLVYAADPEQNAVKGDIFVSCQNIK